MSNATRQPLLEPLLPTPTGSRLFRTVMQRAVTLLVFSLLVFAGCARHYKITLTDQNVITTRSRPKLDRVNNVYRFKDATGATVELPSIRVKEIEPL